MIDISPSPLFIREAEQNGLFQTLCFFNLKQAQQNLELIYIDDFYMVSKGCEKVYERGMPRVDPNAQLRRRQIALQLVKYYYRDGTKF